jgi:peptidyl-tRNA hydrolase
MALRLFARSKNIGRNQGNSYAKFAITPHRLGKVMVEQIRKRNNRKLGGAHKAIYENLQVDI